MRPILPHSLPFPREMAKILLPRRFSKSEWQALLTTLIRCGQYPFESTSPNLTFSLSVCTLLSDSYINQQLRWTCTICKKGEKNGVSNCQSIHDFFMYPTCIFSRCAHGVVSREAICKTIRNWGTRQKINLRPLRFRTDKLNRREHYPTPLINNPIYKSANATNFPSFCS